MRTHGAYTRTQTNACAKREKPVLYAPGIQKRLKLR